MDITGVKNNSYDVCVFMDLFLNVTSAKVKTIFVNSLFRFSLARKPAFCRIRELKII